MFFLPQQSSFSCVHRLSSMNIVSLAYPTWQTYRIFWAFYPSMLFSAQSLWRCTTRSPGWVRPSTSCSWSLRRCCAWHCKPVFSRQESTTLIRHESSPSPQSRAPCVRQVSRQLVLLSSLSTTPEFEHHILEDLKPTEQSFTHMSREKETDDLNQSLKYKKLFRQFIV